MSMWERFGLVVIFNFVIAFSVSYWTHDPSLLLVFLASSLAAALALAARTPFLLIAIAAVYCGMQPELSVVSGTITLAGAIYALVQGRDLTLIG